MWNASSISNTIPRKPSQRRFNSSFKTWAFPYTTLRHTSFRFIKKKMHKEIRNKLKLPRHHELQDSPWRKKMTKGNLNNENLGMPNPFQFLAIIWSIIIFTHWVHEELINGYPAEICSKVLLKDNTLDYMLYWSRDTWASKRKVVLEKGVINKGCLCMVVKNSV